MGTTLIMVRKEPFRVETQASTLPLGPYHVTLLSRRTLLWTGKASAASTPGVELVVRVVDGPRSGHELSFRVYGAARVQRARLLTQGQILRIHVGHHRLDDGRSVTRVADFEPANEASAVDLLEGCDGASIPDPAHVDRPEPASDCGPTPDPARYELIGREYRVGFLARRKQSSRTLVDYEATFLGFAAADEQLVAPGEGYLSLYQYSDDLGAFWELNEKKSLAGYRGATWARWLAIDIDGDGSAESLGAKRDDARKIASALIGLGIPPTHVLVFFSGSSGFHVLFPAAAFAAVPRERFEQVAGILCGSIARRTGVSIDMSLYNPLKPLRAHNTRHDQSGLYKVLLGHDELGVLTSEAIRQEAGRPRPFQLPDWRIPAVSRLAEAWRAACRQADAPHRRNTLAGRVAPDVAGEKKLFADTFDLIGHGAPEGTRAIRFFRASMNLLDFGCPEDLLVALLEPAARLSDYPAPEFMSQIRGAIRTHARPTGTCPPKSFQQLEHKS